MSNLCAPLKGFAATVLGAMLLIFTLATPALADTAQKQAYVNGQPVSASNPVTPHSTVTYVIQAISGTTAPPFGNPSAAVNLSDTTSTGNQAYVAGSLQVPAGSGWTAASLTGGQALNATTIASFNPATVAPPSADGSLAVPIYGGNQFQVAPQILKNMPAVNSSGGGDGYAPVKVVVPGTLTSSTTSRAGHTFLIAYNHHTANANVVCIDYTALKNNVIAGSAAPTTSPQDIGCAASGSFPGSSTLASGVGGSVSSYFASFATFRGLAVGNKVYFPTSWYYDPTGTADTSNGSGSSARPAILCIDVSSGLAKRCTTGTTNQGGTLQPGYTIFNPKSLTTAGMTNTDPNFIYYGAGYTTYQGMIGLVYESGKLCTVWTEQGGTATAPSGTFKTGVTGLHVGCIDPNTAAIVSHERFAVDPASLPGGTSSDSIYIDIKGDTFTAGGPNSTIDLGNGKFSFPITTSGFVGTGATNGVSAHFCIQTNPGSAASTNCDGTPVKILGEKTLSYKDSYHAFAVPRFDAAGTSTPVGYCIGQNSDGSGAGASNTGPGSPANNTSQFIGCYDLNGVRQTNPSWAPAPGAGGSKLFFSGYDGWGSYDPTPGGSVVLIAAGYYSGDYLQCWDWKVNNGDGGPCSTNAVIVSPAATNNYGTTLAEQGCLALFSHSGNFQFYRATVPTTGNGATSTASMGTTNSCNFSGPTLTYTIPNPSTSFCGPVAPTITWNNVAINYPSGVGGTGITLDFLDSSGNPIPGATGVLVPDQTSTGGGTQTVAIPAAVAYATYPTFKIRLNYNGGINSTTSTNIKLQATYNSTSVPQICLQTTTSGSNCGGPGFSNTATLSGGVVGGGSSAGTGALQCANVNLSLLKSALSSTSAGSQGTYTLTVTNATGSSTATTAQVQDALPAGLNLVSATGTNWTCTPNGATASPVGTITCNYANATGIAAGSSSTIAIVVSSTVAGSITNQASVDVTGGSAPVAPTTCTGNGTPTAGCATSTNTIVPGAPFSGTSTLTVTQNNSVAGVNPDIVTATIKDAIGNSVGAGAVVNFTVTPSGASPATGTCTTDATGTCAYSITSNSATTYSVAANLSGTPLSNSPVSVTFKPGPPTNGPLGNKIACSPLSVLADNSATSTCTATLQDQFGNVTTDSGTAHAIAFASPLTGSTLTGSPCTIATGSSTCTVTVKSNKTGADVITATDNGAAIVNPSGGVTVTFTPGPPSDTANGTKIACTPLSVLADNNAVSTCTATLQDQFGNVTTEAIATHTITFASPLTGSTLSGSPCSIAAGSSTCTVTVKSSKTGADVITATDNNGTTTAPIVNPSGGVTVTFTPGPPSDTANGTMIACTPLSVLADNSTVSTCTATLQDQFGNVTTEATATHTITFTSPLTGSTLTGSPCSIAAGSSTCTVTVKSSKTGADVITATDNNGTTTAPIVNPSGGVTVTFTPGPPSDTANGTKIACTPTSLPADNSTTSTCTVTLQDQFGNVATEATATHTVTFASPLTGSTLTGSPCSIVAGSSTCTVTVKSTTAGTDTITATDNNGTTTAPIVNPSGGVTLTFTAGTAKANNSGVRVVTDNSPADNSTADVLEVYVRDATVNPLPGVVVTFAATSGVKFGGGASGAAGTCTTGDGTAGTTLGVCRINAVSAAAATYLTTVSIPDGSLSGGFTAGGNTYGPSQASYTFKAGTATTGQSTLACTPTTSQIAGSTFTCTVTAKDANNNLVGGQAFNLSSQAGSTAAPATCTSSSTAGATLGTCTFTVTSQTGGAYAVHAQIGSTDVSTSPVTVTFTAPVVPTCVAAPNPATTTQSVTITCTGGTSGDTATIPGSSCTSALIPASGNFTCTGTGATLGNNPPLKVTNPKGVTNTGVVPLQITPPSGGVNPPPVPACTASPNPGAPSATITISCTGVQAGTNNVIPGATCTPNPATGTTISCTGLGSGIGNNPTITTTDPVSNLSNSGIVPFNLTTNNTAPYLPNCVAAPNPASGSTNVTITCTNGDPSTQVNIPGCSPGVQSVPPTGNFSCSGTGSNLGSNPPITATNLTTSQSVTGTIPLVVDTTPPAAPACTANPTSAIGTATVAITCAVEKGTTNVIPGTTCTPNPATGTTVTCSGTAGAIGTNPTATSTDPAGNSSTAAIAFTLIGAPDAVKSTLSCTPLTTTVGTNSTCTVTAKDSGGNLVPGAAFTIGSAAGSTTTPATTCTTGTSGAGVGLCTFTVTSQTVGSYAVTAKTGSTDITGSATTIIAFTAGVAASATVAVAPSSAPVTTPITITITAKDQFGNLSSGQSCTAAATTNVNLGGGVSAPGPATSTNSSGVCTFTANSTVAGNYNTPVTVGGITPTGATAYTFTGGTATTGNSTLACTPTTTQIAGSTFTCTATAKDVNNNLIGGQAFNLSSDVGSTTSPATCTSSSTAGATLGTCTFTVTSQVGGNYKVHAQIGTTDVSTSPATVKFSAPVVPICTANPNPAATTASVTITCTGGTQNDKATIPGSNCSATVIPASGNFTCTGTGATLGNNPPLVVTNPNNVTNTGVVPLQIIPPSGGVNPPPVPVCTATPNPGAPTATITINCAGAQIGTNNVIPGATCTPNPATAATFACTGTASAIGNNPTITTTDPVSNLSNSGIVPFHQTTSSTAPVLPVCTALPNPAKGSSNVTITCTGGTPGNTVNIPGSNCSVSPIQSNGQVVCTGTGSNLGSNPPLIVTDPTSGNTATGTVPLVVDSTPPAAPVCTANPTSAISTATVAITCTVEKGTSNAIPGTTCTPNPATGTTVSCSGTASAIGNNPTATSTDPAGNTSTATVAFILIGGADATTSTLACTPTTTQIAGATATCTVTAKDINGNLVPGASFNVGSAAGSTASATTCVSSSTAGPTLGTCTFTVTSNTAGSYTVTAQIGSTNISGSPATVKFSAPVVPTCTASPNPAATTATVTISCTGGTQGDSVTIPGSSCTAATVPAGGSFTCTGTGATLGNNPPLTVTNPHGVTNTGVVPLQITSPPTGGANPPPVPVCTALPNPGSPLATITISCSGVQAGTNNVITGTSCTPNPATGTTITCTGTGSAIGSNPTITTTDPVTNLSNSGIVPFQLTTNSMPVLPVCTAAPNPANNTTAVTITCTGGQPNTQANIPNSSCSSSINIPTSGNFTCTGTGGGLGSNPPITVTDPSTGNTTKGTVPLVVDNVAPAAPACTANPTSAIGTATVAITCTVEKGTNNAIPGTTCTPNPATGTTVTCSGTASAIGNNPTATSTDPAGNTSTALVTFTLIGGADATKSTLVCTPATTQIAGAAFTCTVTAKDASGNLVPGASFNLASAAGSTASAATCTSSSTAGPSFGTCTFTVTSNSAGGYAVTAQIGTTNISGSPATVRFSAPVVPSCTASPNPALTGATVTISCTGGTPGDTVTIPGSSCTSFTVPAGGSFTCTGTGGSLGNNPPLVVTNPNNVTNTGVVPLQITPPSGGVNPPPVPVCTAAPNPAAPTGTVTITCAGVQVGTDNVIPGATCTPNPATAATITCTGTGSVIGNNPTITTTDPATNLSNSGIVPLSLTTSSTPVLPVCTATPNPANGTVTVTISCTGGDPGTTVTIPNSSCNPPITVPSTGNFTCTGTGGNLGSNPPITVTDPTTGDTTKGTVPLVVDTTPPVISCTANPTSAISTATVTITCTVEKGTTNAIPGTTCTPNPAAGVTVTCTGTASAIGNMPTASSTDPAGNIGTTSVAFTPIGGVDATKSTLACIPTTTQIAGAAFTCTVTARDASSNLVPGASFNLASALGSTVSATTCTSSSLSGPSLGTCTFTVTSSVAGSYAVTAQVGSTNITGSPATVKFSAPVVPSCTASPNPAATTANVTISCTGGTAGDSVTIPGSSCTAAAVPAGGSFTCTGTGATLGNNPPLTVTNPNNVTNTGVVPLQITPPSGGVNPPPVPVCTATPNPGAPTATITITCTGVQTGTNNVITGATCTPNPATGTTITCTGTGSAIGTNPTITTTDPVSNLSNSGIVAFQLTTVSTAPVLPVCTATPNPANATTVVTISCTGGESGTQVNVPNSTCSPSITVPTNGNFTCTGTGGNLGSNPPIIVTDPATGNTTTGTIPLVVDTTPPAVPVCVANPTSGTGTDPVSISCTVEKGTTNTIPGTTCTPNPATGTTVTCSGTASAIGTNPTVTSKDAALNTSTATVTFTLIGGPDKDKSTLACAPSSTPVHTNVTCTVTAKDAAGNLVPGTPLNLGSAAGSTPSATSCTTGTSGAALGVCTFTVTSDTANTYAITAQIGSTNISGSPASATFTAGGADPTASTLACTPLSTGVGTNSTCTATAKDAFNNLVGNAAFNVGSAAGSTPSATTCTSSSAAGAAFGTCTFTVTSNTAATYAVTAAIGATPITGSPANVTFTVGAATTTNSTLACTPVTTQIAGATFNCTVTAKDASNNLVGGQAFNLASAPGSTPSATTCTSSSTAGATLGTCSFTVTSDTAGSYAVTAQIGSTNISGSPATVKFSAPVVPACTATPNPATTTANVTVSCTSGTPGDTVTIPGSSCAQTAVPVGGSFTCTGTGASLGNNPPLTVTNPNGVSNTGVVPLQITPPSGGVNPPPVPVCTATPNPASPLGTVTIACTGVQIGTGNVIPGATCTPNPATGTTITCTGAGSAIGSNPTITTTDPVSGLSNSGIVPLNLTTTSAPVLPVCTASPNPANGTSVVTISCTGGQPGTQVNIPNSSCSPAVTVPTSGNFTCTGTGGNLGSNPPIIVTDPATGNTTTGTIPLVVDTTPPAVPVCTANPLSASGTTPVTIACTVETGTTNTIPGATCTPNPATGTSITCTGAANAIGSNPTVTSKDPAGNASTATVVFTFIGSADATKSTLVCTPATAQIAGALFTCTVTAKDAAGSLVAGQPFSLGSAAGSTVSAPTCMSDANGVCAFTVTSKTGGSYAVTAQINSTNITGSPATVSFTAPVVPNCTASPATPTASQAVNVSCTGGTPGDTVSIPGCTPNPATVAADGSMSCSGSGASLGNNPPVTVTNPNGVTNTGVLPLQIAQDQPPPVPVCTATPNPAAPADTVTISCTGVQTGTSNVIPGATCTPDPATGTTITCTGTGSSLGSNPTITTTDPTTHLSNSGVVPLNLNTNTAPPLPVCTTSPNPANSTSTVTITCTSGDPGTTVNIPNSSCSPPITVPTSGNFTCTGTGGSLGNNPPITVTDPGTGLTTTGTIPLVVQPTLTYTAASRATHGKAGTFDIPINLTVPLTSNKLTVEPRAAEPGGVHRVVFTFAATIVSVGAVQLDSTAGSKLATGTAGTPVIDSTNNTVTIPLTGVPNRKRLQVTLTNINGVAGANATVSLAYLLGDVTQDMLVTGLDGATTGANSPSSVKATNFQYNVSLSGGITGLDKALVGAGSPNAVE